MRLPELFVQFPVDGRKRRGYLGRMDFAEKLDAFVRSDPAAEGRFVAAVKTTGIFCRPACKARKPLPENVEFFDTPREALLAGYRPCKLCRPMEKAGGDTPGMVRDLLAEIDADPGIRLNDAALRERGIDPGYVRRWFKKNHGMTFQAYQRMRRLGRAFGLIRTGERVADAATDSGFDSLSSFGDSFRKAFGAAPTKTKVERLIAVTRIPTPLGFMTAAATDEGVCLLEFSDRRALETELGDLKRLLGAQVLPGDSKWFASLVKELSEYFTGSRREFDVPLLTPGTEFQNKVWAALRKIPYGETASYGKQALSMGAPTAVRAVAHANGQNRIAIIIPCHRVLGADGSLTGYAGGLWRKKWLLDMESGKLS